MNVENRIVEKAFAILTSRLREATISISSTPLVERYLLHKLILEEREIFGALWLDVKNRLIAVEDIALGSLSHAPIYPREILKSAMKPNAAKVIFFHHHPSGVVTPSSNDKLLTSTVALDDAHFSGAITKETAFPSAFVIRPLQFSLESVTDTHPSTHQES